MAQAAAALGLGPGADAFFGDAAVAADDLVTIADEVIRHEAAGPPRQVSKFD